MKKKTLAELEREAKQHWEKKTKQLVDAIAEREEVDSNELYPHLVSFFIGEWIEADFKFPEHSLIRFSGYGRHGDDLHMRLELTKEGLQGDYTWMVFVNDSQVSIPRFMGCETLGRALLLAHWVHERDKRSQWI